MVIPTRAEFLESLYARQEDAEKLVELAQASGDHIQEREARKLLAKWRKLITEAGGTPNA